MENLKRDYPQLFRTKEVIKNIKPPHEVVWYNTTPIVTHKETHIEVRKERDSSPIILNKDYKL